MAFAAVSRIPEPATNFNCGRAADGLFFVKYITMNMNGTDVTRIASTGHNPELSLV